MSGFFVEGKRKLNGEIKVAGNKNEALPLIAAALLCPEPITFTNVPDIGDVRTMLKIAAHLGADVSPLVNGSVTLHTKQISTATLPYELCSSIRGSILFASVLLVRQGSVSLPQPGGDTIGRRRIDTHFLVFRELGAVLREERAAHGEGLTYILETENGLHGTEIYLDEASVTGTENALIAAAGAHGDTVIVNAASEPHVQGLCRFLQTMGVAIEGIGSNIITVHGTQRFKPATHAVGTDYIEAGSFAGLAAATHSDLTLTNIDTVYLRMITHQFNRIGVQLAVNHAARTIRIAADQPMKIRRDLGNAIPSIDDAPWPGFPADLMSIMLVTATQCDGTILIHEKMFESRLFFVDMLIGMGAHIVLCDPHRAVIVGPSPLYGATINSPDIRAGMALLIAAMAASGRSSIFNVEQIDRGYQQIDVRLNAVGANIQRIEERRKIK